MFMSIRLNETVIYPKHVLGIGPISDHYRMINGTKYRFTRMTGKNQMTGKDQTSYLVTVFGPGHSDSGTVIHAIRA